MFPFYYTGKHTDFTRKEAILTLFCALFCLLNHIHISPVHFTVQCSSVFDTDHKSLFEFVNHAATVERWFQWVTHYHTVDRRPPGVGKQYRAYFYIPYLGYEKMDFKVVKFSADSHLILQSTHVLQPEVEVTVLALGADKALLTMNITFKQGSLLYQLTIGTYLRYMAKKHMEDALMILSSIKQNLKFK
uniref:Uncharacterized protein n=1 Tax=Homalodisca liturata TaxID=320908 RepID=A0A1B6H901_9HEMI